MGFEEKEEEPEVPEDSTYEFVDSPDIQITVQEEELTESSPNPISIPSESGATIQNSNSEDDEADFEDSVSQANVHESTKVNDSLRSSTLNTPQVFNSRCNSPNPSQTFNSSVFSYNSEDSKFINATSMDSLNTFQAENQLSLNARSSTSSITSICSKMPDKIMVELTVKLTANPSCILSCLVHQLSYPASNSFKKTSPTPSTTCSV